MEVAQREVTAESGDVAFSCVCAIKAEKGLWEPIRGRVGLPRERWAVSELVLNKHTADGQ